MSYDTQRPHIASYVIFRNAKDQVAFVLRANTSWMNDHYGLPSGKVEDEESFIDGAVREAKEEVGVEVNPDELEHVLTMQRFDSGNHAPLWVDLFFEAKKWEGELVNAEPEIHSKLEWLDPKNLPENTIPMLKVAFKAIAEGRTYCQDGW